MFSQTRRNVGLAKLLIVALLLQCLPVFGGLNVVQAAGTDNGEITVQQSTYAPAAALTDYKWKQVHVNLPPEARQAASMVHDEAAENVVLFGGEDNNSLLLDDTWIWDGQQQTWEDMLHLTLSPDKRKSAAMAYDPNSGKVLLFGGEGQSGVLGDTWFWDGLNARWEPVTGLADSPSARGGAQMAFDGENLVLFGGYELSESDAKIPLGDMWLWDGAGWTEAHPTVLPPALHSGQMVYNGDKALLFGGNEGPKTGTYTSTDGNTTKLVTFEQGSTSLWMWDRVAQSWSSIAGPVVEDFNQKVYGRWGNAMAYDGQRAVNVGGVTSYMVMSNLSVIPELKLPNDVGMTAEAVDGWAGGEEWEYISSWYSKQSIYINNWRKSDGREFAVQTVDNPLVPFPISYANMAFDGKNLVYFGGHRDVVKVYEYYDDYYPTYTIPAGKINETWLFGVPEPSAPGVKLAANPVVTIDENDHANDVVSVVTSVYDDGTKNILARGIEYRVYSETGDGPWTDVPYTGSAPAPGSFTVQLTGLEWMQQYEVRGYAVNELGKSYTEIKRFTMTDQNVQPADLQFDRVGAAVLHEKDKKRLVAVGTGISNLLSKPPGNIHYFLEGSDGTQYPLAYHIIDDRKLELTWEDDLPLGQYDVHLEHDFFDDRVFDDGLLLTASNFYKPRNFASIEVASTSGGNEANHLKLKGIFTEDPSVPNVYVLSDASEPVVINDSLLFKGAGLVVDKSGATTTISGDGRLYVNSNHALGAVSYTLYEGPFTISSDNFTIALNAAEAEDYLNLDIPVKANLLTFITSGFRLNAELHLVLPLGDKEIDEWVTTDELIFGNGRFGLFKSFAVDTGLEVGPFDVNGFKVAVNSFASVPYVRFEEMGTLPGTNLRFNLYTLTKQGRLDSIQYNTWTSERLGTTGLKINSLSGSVDNLANKTQIPQTLRVTGSMNDTSSSQLQKGNANYHFNNGEFNANLFSYGLTTNNGTANYYWLPVSNMTMQAVTDAKAAAIKGFSYPGYVVKGNFNLDNKIKGPISMANQAGFKGSITATVRVPAGVPRIGGATVKDVILNVSKDGLYGTFKHNGIGASLWYSVKDNTMSFDVEAEPPKPTWPTWSLRSAVGGGISSIFDATAPWLDIVTGVLGFSKSSKDNPVRILSAAPLPRAFDLTPISASIQPEKPVHTDAQARMVNGQLTTLDQTPFVVTETKASAGKLFASLSVDHSYTALIVLTGDQRAAELKATAAGSTKEQAVQAETTYDADGDTTYMRAALYAGKWNLTTVGSSEIRVNELQFANKTLKLDELGKLWAEAPERSVTSFTVEKPGSYVLKIGKAQGDAIVYKPDGRPYSLQKVQDEPNWNAFRAADGTTYVLLDAAQAGTWMISAGTSPSAILSNAPPATGMDDVAQWAQSQAYPTVFELNQTEHGQAIVEIYGANAQTKLYTPNGNLHALQSDPGLPGMNVLYDESRQKQTIWLDGVDLKGQWKVVSDSFTNVVAYKASKQFLSIKPLTIEGLVSQYFMLEEQGDYMLTVSGGNENTVLIAPNGEPYTLNFAEPDGNAYLQPAADRVLSSDSGGDSPQIVTSNPVNDGQDTLYVSLLNAPAGKWTIQTAKAVDLQIQKLIPLPAITASVSNVAGSSNRIQAAWSTENAAFDTQVTLMLTDSADQPIGEVIRSGLPASGNQAIDLPGDLLPGTYHLSVLGESTDGKPLLTMAQGIVEVTAPVTLQSPEQPNVVATGNEEITLQFASVAGEVSAYRIWVSETGGASAMAPVMDVEPQAGNMQNVVITGLTVGATYDIAVSAIGHAQGRVVLSPLSESVQTALPVPEPATLTVTVDTTGGKAVVEKSYMAYYGSEEQALFTAAEQASLQIGSDQSAALTLFVDGKRLASEQVAADGTAMFDLQALLGVDELRERVYSMRIEAVNERGDRSMAYLKLVIDRTAPLLIASGGLDAQDEPISLNGKVTEDSNVYMTGQTDAGATLVVNGITVPVDDNGQFSYYAPIEWGDSVETAAFVMTAADMAGNETVYKFEVMRGVPGPIPATPGDLASLTVGNARMAAPYQFGQTEYEAAAYADTVRVYAVPMDAAAAVTINDTTLPVSGYMDVALPASGETTVSIKVHSVSAGDKLYSLKLNGTGSSEAALSALTLNDAQTGSGVPGPNFTGAETSYTVHAGNVVDSVTVTPGAAQIGSVIRVNGQTVEGGQASAPIQLIVGENRIPIIVTAPDGVTEREYTLVVIREPSDNARLQNLGIATEGAELLADFSPQTSNYKVFVPDATDEFKLLPITEQADATLRINGQAVTSAMLSLPFTKDMQTIAIEVIAQDGVTSLTYTVAALRRQTVPGQSPTLASLEATPKLDGEFAPYKFKYDTVSQTQNSKVNIVATTSDPNVSVTVQDVTQQGGGTFTPSIAVGENTIIVNVESADRMASQTYSVNVTRVSSGSSSSSPTPMPTEAVRQSKVTGGTGDWIVEIPIVRTSAPDGSVIDTVKLDANMAKDVAAKAKQGHTTVARIQVTDLPDDPADERMVNLSAQALTLLADSGLSLQIELPEGIIELRADSLKQLGQKGTDAYFRIVPIVAAGERKAVDDRVLKAELVQQAADGQPVSIIGRPVKIETNFSGYKTELLLRLDGMKLPTDEAAARRMLSGLAVYIEHSDGEKKLARGEIRFESGQAGIAFEVDKFSTFTIVRLGDSGAAEEATLKPYLSGYPDGTFRPSQSIKRAEFATILHRLGLKSADSSAVGQAADYQDVAAQHWAAEAIAAMQLAGLMRGDTQGRFRPEAAVTRAEMASIVARLLPSGTTGQALTDVPEDVRGHWAASAIGQALQAGILQGYPDGTFRPDSTLTRAEAVRVLNQLLARPTPDVSKSSWPDVPAKHWAIRDIESASGTVTVSSDGSVQIVK